METEYEATFWPIDKDALREKLAAAGAVLSYPERLMRRFVYYLPSSSPLTHAWARVRDEGDKVTMSIKQSGTAIADQKELEIIIDDFDQGVAILRNLGCDEKAYQETKRELWTLDGTDVTIDEWPHLKPHVEVEGPNEESVRKASEKIGFAWDDAKFCSIDVLYTLQYPITTDIINKQTPRLVFNEPNPLEKYLENQT